MKNRGYIYYWGYCKIMDVIIIMFISFWLLLMQKRLVWDGYGNMWYSYHKYESNKKVYKIVEAEVIDTEKLMLAGLGEFASCKVTFCTIRYEYNKREYNVLIKNNPDVEKGDTISVAVYISDPQIVERVEPYPISKYHWKEQIFLLIAEIFIIGFVLHLIDYYRFNT